MIASTNKTRILSSLLFLALVATYATMAAKAQQSPSTTPTTGAANPPRVIPVATAAPARVQQAVARPQQAVAQAQPVAYGDPYGFITWLNATRASYGLSAVGYDPNLAAWAASNNAQQQARGMGHHVMGPARRQNSAVGGYASIGAMWMASPSHRAALLDPTIRWVGIAGLGAYWTYNAY